MNRVCISESAHSLQLPFPICSLYFSTQQKLRNRRRDTAKSDPPLRTKKNKKNCLNIFLIINNYSSFVRPPCCELNLELELPSIILYGVFVITFCWCKERRFSAPHPVNWTPSSRTQCLVTRNRSSKADRRCT